jgi:hypothetical protein
MNWTTTIIEDRWKEACASPNIRRWRSLAYMAGDLADAIEAADPDNIMVGAIRGVSVEAHTRMLDMMPKPAGFYIDDAA